jgi:hypothetical protein
MWDYIKSKFSCDIKAFKTTTYYNKMEITGEELELKFKKGKINGLWQIKKEKWETVGILENVISGFDSATFIFNNGEKSTYTCYTSDKIFRPYEIDLE